MDALTQEIRHAVRRLLRAPSFAVTAILTLALAIGANTSVFTVLDRVVLNPLPYPDSDRLIVLDHGAPGRNIPSGLDSIPLGLYYHYLDRARTLEALALYDTDEMTLTGTPGPERIRVAWATPSLASVLRVPPVQGRWFADIEARPGSPRVAVLSYGLWKRRYGGDPAIVGRSMTLNGVTTEIVGVAPPTFAFPESQTEAWIARQIARSDDFDVFNDTAVARLRDGITIQEARADLNRAIADLPQAYPNHPPASNIVDNLRLTSTAITLKDATVGSVGRALWILWAAVGLVLLVACANVANLFLVRSEARQREVTVRQALGADRLGIARHLLIESVLLSLPAAMFGAMLGWGALRALVRAAPDTLPRLHEIEVTTGTLAFAVVLSAAAALIFGLIPLMHHTARAQALFDDWRGTTSSPRLRLRGVLVGAQIALALVLVVAAGLLVLSFQRLRAVDPGFNATSAITFQIGLPSAEYTDRAAVVAAHQRLLDRLSEVPGVEIASASTLLPLAGFAGYTSPLFVEGRTPPDGTLPPAASSRAVAGNYFESIGMRLLRGRNITRTDVERGELVAVVNEELVRRFFPNQNPLGQRVRIPPFGVATWLTIVGVVADTPTRALAEPEPVSQLFLPILAARVGPTPDAMSYVVRTSSSPESVLPAIRRAIADVDVHLALAQVRTLEEILDRASAQMAFTMALLAIASVAAVLLAVIGVYGAMSYIVSQRTGEIGVRVALGARPAAVVRLIVTQGGTVVGAGVVVGLAVALATGRFIESLLYGVQPRDPGVLIATVLLVLAVAMLACWLPARRAARLNPVEALRAH